MKILLRVVEEEEQTCVSVIALMTLCNLGARREGKTAMMEAGAVAVMARMMRLEGLSEVKREWCVVALFLMSKGSLRFRAMAKEVAAEEVLKQVVEGKIKVAEEKSRRLRTREMAKRALHAMPGEAERDSRVLV